jgi:hypothetical protein
LLEQLGHFLMLGIHPGMSGIEAAVPRNPVHGTLLQSMRLPGSASEPLQLFYAAARG